MQAIAATDIMKVREASIRAKNNGMDISEYTLRRAIKAGQIPCRIVGRTYLVSWNNLLAWATCANSCDNAQNV